MIVFDQLKRNDPHLRAVTLGSLVGMAILLAGLWWVQVVSHRHYSENQKAQSFRTVRIPAVRGKILDRHGTALAENQPSYNVILYLDELREEFKREWARTRPPRTVRLTLAQRRTLEAQTRYRVASNVVQQVSDALGQPVPFAYEFFMRHYTNQLALPVPVLQNIDAAQVARLLEGRQSPRGIDLEVQPLRFYPGASMAAHVLGYLMPDNRSMEGEAADFNFRLPDYRGHVGVEGQFDTELRGKAGVKSVLVNSLGYRQSENIWSPAEPGKNVVLTLDAEIQQATEKALQSIHLSQARGAAIVLDPNTGDILALASLPAYDPNWFIPKMTTETWRWMSDEHLKPQLNRTFYASYAPGSIFKIVTGLSALDHGLDPAEKLYNPGQIRVAGRARPIDDLAKAGEYNFRDAFIHSSNTYFISNGIRYGNIAGIVRLAQRLHLGERTGIMPRQEVPGNFPKTAHQRRGWVDADTAHICIGQGEINATPLQMALLVAAVANGGKVLWPRLVDRIEPADPTFDDPPQVFPRRPARDDLGVTARSLQLTREAMLADVEDEGGTGKAARTPGFHIGGKTGTAEVSERGKIVDRTAWFASYGPWENPRYVVVLMVESGSSGGGICAPAVGRIYKRIHELEQSGRLTAPPPRVALNR